MFRAAHMEYIEPTHCFAARAGCRRGKCMHDLFLTTTEQTHLICNCDALQCTQQATCCIHVKLLDTCSTAAAPPSNPTSPQPPPSPLAGNRQVRLQEPYMLLSDTSRCHSMPHDSNLPGQTTEALAAARAQNSGACILGGSGWRADRGTGWSPGCPAELIDAACQPCTERSQSIHHMAEATGLHVTCWAAAFGNCTKHLIRELSLI